MAKTIDVEAVDLAALANGLRNAISEPPIGEIVGRTVLRDAVVDLLDCSELEAENLVETMISRGMLVRRADERSDDVVEWQIRANTN
jgi:hypothetical protein